MILLPELQINNATRLQNFISSIYQCKSYPNCGKVLWEIISKYKAALAEKNKPEPVVVAPAPISDPQPEKMDTNEGENVDGETRKKKKSKKSTADVDMVESIDTAVEKKKKKRTRTGTISIAVGGGLLTVSRLQTIPTLPRNQRRREPRRRLAIQSRLSMQKWARAKRRRKKVLSIYSSIIDLWFLWCSGTNCRRSDRRGEWQCRDDDGEEEEETERFIGFLSLIFHVWLQLRRLNQLSL